MSISFNITWQRFLRDRFIWGCYGLVTSMLLKVFGTFGDDLLNLVAVDTCLAGGLFGTGFAFLAFVFDV